MRQAATKLPLPDREKVVLVHSSGSSPRQWAQLASRLASDRRLQVVAPPLVGHDAEPGWSRNEAPSLAGEVERLCAHLGRVRGPVHLVGHSYGGAVALKAALSGRFEVASIALYEPSLFAFLEERLDEYRASPTAIARAIAWSLAIHCPHEAARIYVDYWNGPRTFATMSPEKSARIVERMPIVKACFDALVCDEMRAPDLSALTAPCLVMCGARSPQPSQDICELVAGHSPRGRLHRFAELGHMGPVLAPAAVNAVIEEFLEFVPARSVRASV